MFEIEIEWGDTPERLARIAAGLANASPLMRAIAAELASQTEANFEAEGRPRWLGLAPATVARRTRQGTWPGRIMQVSGQLAASYSTDFDAGSAVIGSNKPYAAIQNLGGQAGRGHRAKIPARPQIPIDPQGNLQPEAQEAILGVVNDYLRRISG